MSDKYNVLQLIFAENPILPRILLTIRATDLHLHRMGQKGDETASWLKGCRSLQVDFRKQNTPDAKYGNR